MSTFTPRRPDSRQKVRLTSALCHGVMPRAKRSDFRMAFYIGVFGRIVIAPMAPTLPTHGRLKEKKCLVSSALFLPISRRRHLSSDSIDVAFSTRNCGIRNPRNTYQETTQARELSTRSGNIDECFLGASLKRRRLF